MQTKYSNIFVSFIHFMYKKKNNTIILCYARRLGIAFIQRSMIYNILQTFVALMFLN